MPQDAQWALQLALYEATLLPTLSSKSEQNIGIWVLLSGLAFRKASMDAPFLRKTV